MAGDLVAGNSVNIGKAFGAMALGALISFGGGAGAQYGQLGARQAALAVKQSLSKVTANTAKQQYVKGLVSAGNVSAITRHTSNLMFYAMNAVYRGIPYNVYMEVYQKLLFC